MTTVTQSVSPTILVYSHENKRVYYEFSANSHDLSGKNLQSYSFLKSINNFTGTFQFTVKENIENYTKGLSFYNNVRNLDVVVIKENQDIDFIGVITSVSFSGVANGFQKVINISGKSIEYLFEYLTISLDATAMAWAGSSINTAIANISAKLSTNEDGTAKGCVAVKDAFKSIYNEFVTVAKDHATLSNVAIINLIEDWFGTDYIVCDSKLEFKYPISSNLFTNGTCNFISYLKNLLPQNVYEIFGVIEGGKPKIKIREVPFSAENWKNLGSITIDPLYLEQYTTTKSIEEVYTVFYSYVEGSPVSPEFQEVLNAIQMGKNANTAPAAYDSNKIAKYGYKPLKCNFIGFRTEVAVETEDTFISNIKELNEKLKNWYGNLDTMLDATFVVVKKNDANIYTIKNGLGNIGEKIKFNKGQFYIAGVEHSWRYGSSVKITYHCERGGHYDNAGNYNELLDITAPYGELK